MGQEYEYELTCGTKGAEIRYTLDGSEPDTDSMLYTPGMTAPRSATVRFRAFREGMVPSETARSDGDQVEESVKPGDVNMDGAVTAVDALLSLRENVSPGTLSEKALQAADMDGDGTVTIKEVQEILKRASKKER